MYVLYTLLSIIDNYKFRTCSFTDYVVTDDNRAPIKTRLKIKYYKDVYLFTEVILVIVLTLPHIFVTIVFF